MEQGQNDPALAAEATLPAASLPAPTSRHSPFHAFVCSEVQRVVRGAEPTTRFDQNGWCWLSAGALDILHEAELPALLEALEAMKRQAPETDADKAEARAVLQRTLAVLQGLSRGPMASGRRGR
ncbi:MAG: hypothetical protein ACPGUV_04240 [Polyangiales bacterium]